MGAPTVEAPPTNNGFSKGFGGVGGPVSFFLAPTLAFGPRSVLILMSFCFFMVFTEAYKLLSLGADGVPEPVFILLYISLSTVSSSVAHS